MQKGYSLHKKRPNIFVRAFSVSILYQLKLYNRFYLCLAGVHLPYLFHSVVGFQLLGHAVSLRLFPSRSALYGVPSLLQSL